MYSCFHDPFMHPCVSNSGLEKILKDEGITHVYIVGLAMDYCVKYSAIDAKKAGFEVYVVKEGTKAVDPNVWDEVVDELAGLKIGVIGMEGVELGWLKEEKQ